MFYLLAISGTWIVIFVFQVPRITHKMMLTRERYSTIYGRSIACEQDITSIEVITKDLTAMDLRFHENIIYHKHTSRLRWLCTSITSLHVPPHWLFVNWRPSCHHSRRMSIKLFEVVWFTIFLVNAATCAMLDRLTGTFSHYSWSISDHLSLALR